MAMLRKLGDSLLIGCVQVFSLGALALSFVFNPAFGGTTAAPAMPGYLGFLFVGLLGVLVSVVLLTQQRRIRVLEQALRASDAPR